MTHLLHGNSGQIVVLTGKLTSGLVVGDIIAMLLGKHILLLEVLVLVQLKRQLCRRMVPHVLDNTSHAYAFMNKCQFERATLPQ